MLSETAPLLRGRTVVGSLHGAVRVDVQIAGLHRERQTREGHAPADSAQKTGDMEHPRKPRHVGERLGARAPGVLVVTDVDGAVQDVGGEGNLVLRLVGGAARIGGVRGTSPSGGGCLLPSALLSASDRRSTKHLSPLVVP